MGSKTGSAKSNKAGDHPNATLASPSHERLIGAAFPLKRQRQDTNTKADRHAKPASSHIQDASMTECLPRGSPHECIQRSSSNEHAHDGSYGRVSLVNILCKRASASHAKPSP
eukprot:2258093-Amphidinium_carterae.1